MNDYTHMYVYVFVCELYHFNDNVTLKSYIA